MQAKKSLGQNFLINHDVVRETVGASNITKNETVLEVGPGKGVLTQALLKTGAKVVAVEKDESLVKFLQAKFANEIANGQLHLISGDILNFDISSLFAHCKLQISSYKLVANIPYYITGELIQKFLSSEHKPTSMVLMLQKEVAERIVGGNPTSLKLRGARESILSLSVKAYGTPEYIRTVPRTSFEPAPNVDSAVIAIRDISGNFFANESAKTFFKLVKAGFAHKRKKLASNLKGLVSAECLAELGDKRAQQLELADWRRLCASATSSS